MAIACTLNEKHSLEKKGSLTSYPWTLSSLDEVDYVNTQVRLILPVKNINHPNGSDFCLAYTTGKEEGILMIQPEQSQDYW